jgi:cellobiose phosphorylase
VNRDWRGATYEITVHNRDGVDSGVKSVLLDGSPVEPVYDPATGRLTARIPRQDSGTHTVEVTLG